MIRNVIDVIRNEMAMKEILPSHNLKVKIVDSFAFAKENDNVDSLSEMGYTVPCNISTDGNRTYKVRKAVFTTCENRATGTNWSVIVPKGTPDTVFHGCEEIIDESVVESLTLEDIFA